MTEKAFEKATDDESDTWSPSFSFTRGFSFFSVPRRTALAAAPTVGRGLRSVLTAFIALSVGVALVWWLKAGTDDPPPALQKRASTSAAASGRAPWAHRNELAPASSSGSHH
jgi:hypothetical protein